MQTLSQENRRRPKVLIKEKQHGKIKERTVTNRRPQQKIFSKDKTASPTVSLEALLLSLMLDAKEERDVATTNVGSAFLHSDMEDFVILKMVGNAVDILCNVNPEFKKYVIIKNRK